MPIKTVPAAQESNKLLSSRKPSRDTGANIPPGFSAGARQANRISEPPMVTIRRARIKTPRVGSVAKEWTEVKTPERTRKVPIRESEKVRMASSTVQLFMASRFSTTVANAVLAPVVGEYVQNVLF